MNSLLRHAVKAYRPLYQRGLLMDGQYPRPLSDASGNAREPFSNGPRMLLVALTGLRSIPFFHRNKS